ncbi:MAG: ATP-dependent RNA helicase HrpA [Limisphaerales bacterium]
MTDPVLDELRGLLPRCMTRDWVRLGGRLVRLLKDRNHVDRHQPVLARLLEQARESAALREQRRLLVPNCTYPEALPIVARRDEIVSSIRSHQVVVIAGETGSGKTTQIPKMCLEAGLGIEAMIGCTQPRRVAAQSISRRIAEELDVAWGRQVGCKVRFDDQTGPETHVKLMTDGILLAETQGDPLLADYNALIIDEAHERSLNIDFLIGYLQGLIRQRRDLKLLITSATLDIGAFSRAFGDAPVIEVSGRTFPVEVRHEPLGGEEDGEPETSYLEAAVETATRTLMESSDGDLLVFLPSERDIREATDQLEGRHGREIEVIPLYGRLAAADQQRVFRSSERRRIVLATNIAETSLTLPGIRFVIDTGFARISRYNPRTRTRRLPIEPISQSSANQRKGRAGRVEAGICIRLYSEEDYLGRPAHTQPEIQRANLAEVILRMKAFRLGEIETFPFLNPPPASAISGGYSLLVELGALDDTHALTPLGWDLARLPIDPTLGRMVLQARREGSVRELLVIAAGLSIQDPRERPSDREAAADAAHRRHAHPASDFLSLLNLWHFVQDGWSGLRTQGQRRRFCQTHFLSYLRLREWIDLENQLEEALQDLLGDEAVADPGTETRRLEVGSRPGDRHYDGIHRSILSGLLSNIGRRHERSQYHIAGNRIARLFPGSTLAPRQEPQRGGERPRRDAAPPAQKGGTPEWIVAGEVVETSQLFLRTAAAIDPAWIPDLAPHRVRIAHTNPRWVASAGQVVADEVITLHGLEVVRRRIAFSRIDPEAATALFIRSALVEEDLLPGRRGGEDAGENDEPGAWRRSAEAATPLPPQYRFLDHNRRERERIEALQTRIRHRVVDLDQALATFYAARLQGIGSVSDLNRWLAGNGGPDALCARAEDLAPGRDLAYDQEAFPGMVPIDGQPVPVRYAYAPGEGHDGVTLRIPIALADAVSAARLEWAIPGLRAGRVEEWLRSLPKALRKQLHPIAPKVEEIVRDLTPEGPTLEHDLRRFLKRHYGIEVAAAEGPSSGMPPHLQPRVEVVDPRQKVIAEGRDWSALRASLPRQRVATPMESDGWRIAATRWERFGVVEWTFGDLPDSVTWGGAGTSGGIAFPGLEFEEGQVNVRLFLSASQARRSSEAGFRRLLELALHKDLAWLERDLRGLNRLAERWAPLGTIDRLRDNALLLARRRVLSGSLPTRWTRQEFESALAGGRQRIPGLAQEIIDRVAEILEIRSSIARSLGLPAQGGPTTGKPLKSLDQLSLPGSPTSVRSSPAATPAAAQIGQELQRLVSAEFPSDIPHDRLQHLPRYLKALGLRLERARQNAPRDLERQGQIRPFVLAVEDLRRGATDPAVLEKIDAFSWMVEELKVSVFAQELGTASPVSERRLQEHLDLLRTG